MKMEFNLVSQTIVVIMFTILFGMFITAIGFFGLQHQKLLVDVKDVVNITEKENFVDRSRSDNQTRIIIVNVTGTATNATQAILKNTTTLMSQQFEVLNSKLDRIEGIEVRIHNDVQQLLERDNERNNETSHILNILPDPFR